jgi:hypothetical protein
MQQNHWLIALFFLFLQERNERSRAFKKNSSPLFEEKILNLG